jgi:1,6-anhydro-N-acetylmuramate kinase
VRGIADALEAYGFALLAWAAAHARPAGLRVVTGARTSPVLGQIAPGRAFRGVRLAGAV